MKSLAIRPIVTATLLTTCSLGAWATNGYFSHGYGIKAKGMGGRLWRPWTTPLQARTTRLPLHLLVTELRSVWTCSCPIGALSVSTVSMQGRVAT